MPPSMSRSSWPRRIVSDDEDEPSPASVSSKRKRLAGDEHSLRDILNTGAPKKRRRKKQKASAGGALSLEEKNSCYRDAARWITKALDPFINFDRIFLQAEKAPDIHEDRDADPDYQKVCDGYSYALFKHICPFFDLDEIVIHENETDDVKEAKDNARYDLFKLLNARSSNSHSTDASSLKPIIMQLLLADLPPAPAASISGEEDDATTVAARELEATLAPLRTPLSSVSDKSSRGWHAVATARALVPPAKTARFLEDMPKFMANMREQVEPNRAGDMPSFLYPNFREVSFDELPMGGLLRSPFVVRTLKHIYSGPRAATEATIDFKRNQAKLGCAARHGITKVTEEMIAYTVLLIRFCLSADDHWNRSEDGMRLEHFHRKVMSLFYGPLSKEVDDDDEEEATRWGYVGSASEDMTKEEYELVDRARTEWTKDLCDWYSQYLFGTQAVPKPARPIVRIDAPLTTAERLQQQIVARIRKEQQTAPQDASPDGSPALINLPSPVASGSSPVASGSSPLASGSSPVASGSSPVASSSTNRTALPCLTPPDASSSASTRSPPPPLGDVTQHEDVDNARSVQPKKGVRQNKPPPAARKRPANLNVTQRSLRNRIV